MIFNENGEILVEGLFDLFKNIKRKPPEKTDSRGKQLTSEEKEILAKDMYDVLERIAPNILKITKEELNKQDIKYDIDAVNKYSFPKILNYGMPKYSGITNMMAPFPLIMVNADANWTGIINRIEQECRVPSYYLIGYMYADMLSQFLTTNQNMGALIITMYNVKQACQTLL